MSSRVSHVVACVRTSFLSKTESSSIACRDHTWFILSSTDGCLGCPPVLFMFLDNPVESKVVERRISIRFPSRGTSQEPSTSGVTETRKKQRDRESRPWGAPWQRATASECKREGNWVQMAGWNEHRVRKNTHRGPSSQRKEGREREMCPGRKQHSCSWLRKGRLSGEGGGVCIAPAA